VSEPRVVETHVSRLVFTPDRVYKVKKPVAFGFVDLSTAEARRAACEAEVRLNRRLAPDVYEGVGTYVSPEGDEEPIVVMRRLPDDRRLSHLIRQEDPAVIMHLEALAQVLADFHRMARRGNPIDSLCRPEAVLRLWSNNLSELASVAGELIPGDVQAEIYRLSSRYIAGRVDLFLARIEAGRSVDGHGDLLADDIFCLDDGERVLDCLEFDDRLRYGDALSDVSFLAMDLERLGHPEFAAAFLDFYRAVSRDEWPNSLADFYIAYRASVRAKVACINARRGDLGAAGQARLLGDMALAHLQSGAIRLVLVGGLPGTGKSTIAKHLSDATGWPLLHSDIMRKQLAGLDPRESASAAFGGGLYSADWTAFVYERLLESAEELMRMGHSVIIDATWNHRAWRDGAAGVADRCHADLIGLRCASPRGLAHRRLLERGLDHWGSDATPAIADILASAMEPWCGAEVIDTSETLAASTLAALRAIGLASKPGSPTKAASEGG
jgi:aminoglycoside phosphotransferase family enzyme/predicted kinase